jgi:hypothetical protein
LRLDASRSPRAAVLAVLQARLRESPRGPLAVLRQSSRCDSALAADGASPFFAQIVGTPPRPAVAGGFAVNVPRLFRFPEIQSGNSRAFTVPDSGAERL